MNIPVLTAQGKPCGIQLIADRYLNLFSSSFNFILRTPQNMCEISMIKYYVLISITTKKKEIDCI